MTAGRLLGCFVCLALLVVCGCGSGGAPTRGGLPGGGGPPGGTGGGDYSLGSIQVRTDRAWDWQMLPVPSPHGSPVAFTILQGARIVYLSQLGPAAIAFETSRAGGGREIYVMNADGSGLANLSRSPSGDREPAWSPDGSKIAFASNRTGYWDILTMNADGSGQLNVTHGPGQDREPTWSPDGSRIAFRSDRDGAPDIYVMDANGSNATNVTHDGYGDQQPAWSPDGSRIAYATRRGRSLQWEIFTVNVDGSGKTDVTNSPGSDLDPAWSPDGSSIAFRSDRDRSPDIYVMPASGAYAARRLTDAPSLDDHPSWSGDGTKIAFVSNRAGPYDIYVMNALDGSDQTPLTNDVYPDITPAWRPTAGPGQRTLVGPPGSDGGSDPPLGPQAPLAIVGLTDQRLVSAVTVGAYDEASWSSIQAEAIPNAGDRLVGVSVTGDLITNVRHDVAQGVAPAVWNGPLEGARAAVIFLSAQTGQVASVLFSFDTGPILSGSADGVAMTDGRIVVRGEFVAAYNGAQPERNLLAGPTQDVVLDAATGEVLVGG